MAAVLTRIAGAAVTEGTLRETFFDITFDAAYATGGVAITARSAGLLNIIGVDILGQALTSGAARTTNFYPEWDSATQKLQFWGSNGAAPAALAEMANATALSTFVVRVRIVGFQ